MSESFPKSRSGSEKRQRSGLVQFRVSPAEQAQIEAAAERAGLTAGAFARHQCLGSAGPRAMRRPPIERVALAQLLGQIGKVGSNVNQIARAIHSGRDDPYDLGGVLAEIREVARAISHALRGKAP